MRDDQRTSGRTTGLVLQAISRAVLAPGIETEFIDHSRHDLRWVLSYARCLQSACAALSLGDMKIRVDGPRVFIKSEYVPRYKRPQIEVSNA
jgi:hypothetical protein